MPIVVNGVELSDTEVAQEMALHQDSDQPLHSAVMARILRIVMLDEARRLGLPTDDEEQAIEQLLAQQAASNAPDEAACRRFYEANTQRFEVGGCVEAQHILFQVTPNVDLEALRLTAEDVLRELIEEPARFGQLASTYSNCPSAQVGGSLGQLSRGDTVPEFERVLFTIPAGSVHPQLIHSRHGLHIVRVARHEPGRVLPFELARADIEQVLSAMGRDTAWRQYLKVLVARAQIDGIDLTSMAEGENIMGAQYAHGQHQHAHSHEHAHSHQQERAPAHAGCHCGAAGGQGACA